MEFTCPRCVGKCKVKKIIKTRCVSCLGTTLHLQEHPLEKVCKDCNGVGYFENEKMVTCTLCQGQGLCESIGYMFSKL